MEPAEWEGATGAVAPVADFSVCTADTEILCGALLRGPLQCPCHWHGHCRGPHGPHDTPYRHPVPGGRTARNRMAVWGVGIPRRAAENRRETAGFPLLTAAKPPRSECPAGHRQPVAGAPASPAPAVLHRRGRNEPLSLSTRDKEKVQSKGNAQSNSWSSSFLMTIRSSAVMASSWLAEDLTSQGLRHMGG
ncbi:hypothetical protein NDU88_003236 [Pleurodeles waltl]|uniref:Uncharacterized protein n=1 Tax=Pleurodeles waltl TaxID=8319 RepID=A0AAV7RFZ7_PLEWA|nr:hypothetical protein NDU88_003236 [Pleurodeles waltl]